MSAMAVEFIETLDELGEWHAFHVGSSDKDKVVEDKDALVEYTVLSSWRKGRDEKVSFDLYVTDGAQAWTGKGLQRPSTSTHEKWNEMAFRALTGKGKKTGDEDDGCGIDVQLTAKVTEGERPLEFRWTWNETVMKERVRVNGWLESSLTRCSEKEASRVIRFMFSKLVECNALMVDLSQQAKRSLAGLRSSYEESQKRFDAYRRQERDRTQDLMLKCTDILNREHRHGQDRRQQHASSSAQASPQKRRRKIV